MAAVLEPILVPRFHSSCRWAQFVGAKWGAIIDRCRATRSATGRSKVLIYLVLCGSGPRWPMAESSMTWRGSGVRIPSAPPRGLHVSVGAVFTFGLVFRGGVVVLPGPGWTGGRRRRPFLLFGVWVACPGRLVLRAVVAAARAGAAVRPARRMRPRWASCGAACGFSGAGPWRRGAGCLPAGCSRLPGCAGCGR